MGLPQPPHPRWPAQRSSMREDAGVLVKRTCQELLAGHAQVILLLWHSSERRLPPSRSTQRWTRCSPVLPPIAAHRGPSSSDSSWPWSSSSIEPTQSRRPLASFGVVCQSAAMSRSSSPVGADEHASLARLSAQPLQRRRSRIQKARSAGRMTGRCRWVDVASCSRRARFSITRSHRASKSERSVGRRATSRRTIEPARIQAVGAIVNRFRANEVLASDRRARSESLDITMLLH